MQTFFKHDSEPAVITRRKRRAEDDASLRAAYDDVDARDAGYCWVTGRYTSPHNPDPRGRREHHHLEARSIAPERRSDPNNIVTVCAEAHALFKAGWLVSEGTDAREPLFFHWTENAKSKPFEIKARRQMRLEE